MSLERPFQKLDDRLAGLPVDQTLHEGVTEWITPPLREWLDEVLSDELALRVTLRLRWRRAPSDTYVTLLTNAERRNLLTVVDATLQLHHGWDTYSEETLRAW